MRGLLGVLCILVVSCATARPERITQSGTASCLAAVSAMATQTSEADFLRWACE